jgi:hypothetical protein
MKRYHPLNEIASSKVLYALTVLILLAAYHSNHHVRLVYEAQTVHDCIQKERIDSRCFGEFPSNTLLGLRNTTKLFQKRLLPHG